MKIINYDNKIDEINRENIIFHGCEEKDFLEIHWEILDGCNYKCSYCPVKDVLDNNFTPIEKLQHAVDEVLKIDKKFYNFIIYGGEPTFYPYLYELIEYIYSFDNKNITIQLITNASKNLDYFKNLISHIKKEFFNMIISIHIEYANIEHIKEVAKLFYKNNLRILLKLMIIPDYKEKAYKYFDELIELRKYSYFDLELSAVQYSYSDPWIYKKYDSELLKWLNDSNQLIENTKLENLDFINKDLHPDVYFSIKENDIIRDISINYILSNRLENDFLDFRGFYCCAGINMIHINKDGNYKAAYCDTYKFIGNLYEEEINLYKLTNLKRCNYPYSCSCTSNFLNMKHRDIYNAKKYVLEYRKKHLNLFISSLLNTFDDMDFDDKIELLNNRIDKIYSNELEMNTNINNLNNELLHFNRNMNTIINTISWWIPVKKWRENFRNKFRPDQTRPDQTRPDQTRPDQTRPDQTRPNNM